MVAISRQKAPKTEGDEGLAGINFKPTLSPQYGTPEGRVPFGDGSSGWYHTPETIDPQDCVNYPDSPWCGGNPFSKQPIGLDVEVNINPCGVDVNVQPTFLYIKLPVHGVSYRLPGDCRQDPPPKTDPTPQPGQINYQGFDINVDSKIQVFAFISNSQDAAYTYTNHWSCGSLAGKSFPAPEGWVSSCSNFRCPGDMVTVSGNSQQAPVGCDWTYEVYTTGFKTNIPSSYASGTYCVDKPYKDSSVSKSPANYNNGAYILTYIHDEAGNIRQWKTNNGQSSTINYSISALYETSYCEPYSGMPLRIWKGYYRHIKFFVVQPRAIENYKTVTVKLEYVVGTNCAYPIISPYDKNPPPPPPPPKDCCMTCCSPTTQQNDYTALLQQILAECRKARQAAEDAQEKATKASEDALKAVDEAKKVNDTVGTSEFPATLPEGLSSSRGGTLTLKNIPQILKQQIIYLDEIIGETPVKIKIQDADILKEGDQSVELTFDNALELGAEHLGFTINSSINIELLVQLHSKSLIEIAVLRKQLHTLQSAVNAMVQYLGYDVKETYEEIPFTISVPKTDKMDEFNMTEFTKESTQKVEIYKLEKKEVGAHRKYMLTLQKMAGIITAVFWKKIIKGGIDLASQMKSMFDKQNQTINDVDKHQEELEKWLEEYQIGFTTTEGYQGDPAKPWGEDFENRPRTKIVGKLNADVQKPKE